MTGIKPDRRQVVRAGVWAVPAIAVATAAPAFAASTANLSDSQIGAVTTTGNGSNREARFTVTIINNGGADTTALQIRIVFSGTAPTGQPAPSGFSAPVVDPTNPNALIYTSTSGQVTAGGGTKTVNFILYPGNSGTTATVTLIPGGNGTGKTFPTMSL